jgi:hypothetical protein
MSSSASGMTAFLTDMELWSCGAHKAAAQACARAPSGGGAEPWAALPPLRARADDDGSDTFSGLSEFLAPCDDDDDGVVCSGGGGRKTVRARAGRVCVACVRGRGGVRAACVRVCVLRGGACAPRARARRVRARAPCRRAAAAAGARRGGAHTRTHALPTRAVSGAVARRTHDARTRAPSLASCYAANTPPRASVPVRHRPAQVPDFTPEQLAFDARYALYALASETRARAAGDAADAAFAAALAPPLPKPAPFAAGAAALIRATTRDACTQTGAGAARARPAPARSPPPPPPPPPLKRPHAPPARASGKKQQLKRHTGAGAPWLRAEDAALRGAVREFGRAWETIRARVESAAAAAVCADDDAYARLFSHLGAPGSKCLRKRWDRLAELDARGEAPHYRG